MDDIGAAALAPQKKKRPRSNPGAYVGELKDKKLKTKLKHTERVYQFAHKTAAKAQEWLAPADGGRLEAENELESTWHFKQQDVVSAVAAGAARKAFDLRLPELGPYRCAFSRAGRHVVLGGARGHLAVLEWQRQHLVCEVQVAETTRDVTFLHNELFFAAAQKKYVYIYDKRGLEVHCLRQHLAPTALQFLPHHFLLASIGESGVLTYQDTSMGQIVAQHRTRLGTAEAMAQNPYNAVLCCAHSNGTVTMWTPNMSTPVVKMLCHKAAVKALAVDPTGHQLVTAGVDCQIKVWDVRKFTPLHTFYSHSPATQLDISQKGLLAVAHGRKVQIWQDALTSKPEHPYMSHMCEVGGVHSLAFVPYEDVLGVGAAEGVGTILVPGAGEPNFDSWVANPYQSIKERQQQEVAQLLDKLQPDTICLDPDYVGKLLREPNHVHKERKAAEAAANAASRAKQQAKADEKSRVKGKNKPTRRQHKKQQNIIEEKKPTIKAKQAEEEQRRLEQAAAAKAALLDKVPRALQRFYK